MGLTDWWSRAAAACPQVLLVPVPGEGARHRAAEQALDELGWGRAAGPAQADVLLECGAVGPQLAGPVEVAWGAMPGPRARCRWVGGDVREVLREAQAGLADRAGQRDDARTRPPPPLSAAQAAPSGHDEPDQDEADAPGHGGGRDMDHDMDMGDGGDMDMGMDLPGGLVMADRLQDRDGLRLEGLHLTLGPLLPAWPAGLLLAVTLSGDVVVQAGVRLLDPRPELAPDLDDRARAFDLLARLLEAAGWQDGAVRARRARTDGGVGAAADDLLRRLRRARLLRWALRDLPGPGGVDLVAHLDRLVAAARGGAGPRPVPPGDLVEAVTGLELGSASLVVAAFGPLLQAVPADA